MVWDTYLGTFSSNSCEMNGINEILLMRSSTFSHSGSLIQIYLQFKHAYDILYKYGKGSKGF